MKFSRFMIYSAIQADLQATTKLEAIREAFTAISNAGLIAPTDLDACIQLAMKREELGTSGIGFGCAVPATVYPPIERPMAALFLSQKGIDFDSLDGERVHVLFAVVKQPKMPEEYLRMLEYFSRSMKLEANWSRLQKCRSRQEVMDWLDAIDTVMGE